MESSKTVNSLISRRREIIQKVREEGRCVPFASYEDWMEILDDMIEGYYLYLYSDLNLKKEDPIRTFKVQQAFSYWMKYGEYITQITRNQ